MSEYIALSANELSRLRYHWFWGLETGDVDSGNLLSAVQDLQDKPVQLANVVKQMESVWSHYWFIRAIYWLFNIGQYRKNYYVMQCYIARELYEQEVKMLPTQQQYEKNSSIEAAILVTVGLASLVVIHRVMRHLGPDSYFNFAQQMTWFGEKITPWFNNLNKIYRKSNSIEEDELPAATRLSYYAQMVEKGSDFNNVYFDSNMTFKVTAVLWQPLITLGFAESLVLGDEICFRDVKKKYLQRLSLVQHCGVDVESELKTVRKAYNYILDELKDFAASYAQNNTLTAFLSLLIGAQALESDRKLNDLLKANEVLRKNMAIFDDELSKTHKAAVAVHQDFKNLGQDFKNLRKEEVLLNNTINSSYDRLIKRMDDLLSSQREFLALESKHAERIAAAEATKAAVYLNNLFVVTDAIRPLLVQLGFSVNSIPQKNGLLKVASFQLIRKKYLRAIKVHSEREPMYDGFSAIEQAYQDIITILQSEIDKNVDDAYFINYVKVFNTHVTIEKNIRLEFYSLKKTIMNKPLHEFNNDEVTQPSQNIMTDPQQQQMTNPSSISNNRYGLNYNSTSVSSNNTSNSHANIKSTM